MQQWPHGPCVCSWVAAPARGPAVAHHGGPRAPQSTSALHSAEVSSKYSESVGRAKTRDLPAHPPGLPSTAEQAQPLGSKQNPIF